MKKILGNLLLLAGSLTFALEAVEPYDSIRMVPYEPFFLSDSYILLNKIFNSGSTTVIDVGSEKGGVARYLAANTDSSIGIYQIGEWNENEYAFQKNLSNIIHENLTERIVPLRMASEEASAALNLNADFIFINSSNADNVYSEIISWYSHLTPNGIIAGNNWEWSSVELEVVKAASDLNMAFNFDGPYWFLQDR